MTQKSLLFKALITFLSLAFLIRVPLYASEQIPSKAANNMPTDTMVTHLLARLPKPGISSDINKLINSFNTPQDSCENPIQFISRATTIPKEWGIVLDIIQDNRTGHIKLLTKRKYTAFVWNNRALCSLSMALAVTSGMSLLFYACSQAARCSFYTPKPSTYLKTSTFYGALCLLASSPEILSPLFITKYELLICDITDKIIERCYSSTADLGYACFLDNAHEVLFQEADGTERKVSYNQTIGNWTTTPSEAALMDTQILSQSIRNSGGHWQKNRELAHMRSGYEAAWINRNVFHVVDEFEGSKIRSALQHTKMIKAEITTAIRLHRKGERPHYIESFELQSADTTKTIQKIFIPSALPKDLYAYRRHGNYILLSSDAQQTYWLIDISSTHKLAAHELNQKIYGARHKQFTSTHSLIKKIAITGTCLTASYMATQSIFTLLTYRRLLSSIFLF